jgi:hypothetical protein
MSYNGLFCDNQSFRFEQNVNDGLKKRNAQKNLINCKKEKLKLKFIAPKSIP